MSLFAPRFTVPLSLFWLTFVVIAFSDAAAYYLVVVLAVWVIGLWGLSWLVRVIIVLAGFRMSRSKEKAPQPAKRWKLVALGIEPTAVILSLALVVFAIPTKIRLKLSEPELITYVQDIRAGRRSPQKSEDPALLIGLFRVRETELLEGGIVRLITAEDFVDHAGFVYLPKQRPPVRGEDSYRRIYGSWWLWQRSW